MEIHRSGGVTIHANPGPPAGGNEHARHGPGENYHVHIKDKDGNTVRMSTENWKPLTPKDEEILNRSKDIKKVCENLTDADKKFFDKVNREVFHRGRPTPAQTLRLLEMRRIPVRMRGDE